MWDEEAFQKKLKEDEEKWPEYDYSHFDNYFERLRDGELGYTVEPIVEEEQGSAVDEDPGHV